MIASLRGTLLFKSPTEVIIEAGGIGYSVNVSLTTSSALGSVNAPVSLLTHLHVREDALQLYGFSTEEERSIFRLLLSVSGIGPRMGQTILSGISVSDLRRHILSGNPGALTTIPGVGKKLAERLVVELREKMAKMDSDVASSPDLRTHTRSQALLALTSLGYSRVVAEKALFAALKETAGDEISVEALIKTALRHATK